MKPLAIGPMRVRRFAESGGPMPLPYTVFPDLTPERFARLKPDLDPRALGAEPDTLGISMHTFVLESRGTVILIDTCNGNDKTRTGPMAGMNMLKTPYLENLAALGLRPENVGVVMCTHLHSDHVGWNTKLENGKWVPTFPNARYIMTKADVDYFATVPLDTFQGSITREAYNDSVLPVIAAGKAELVETNHVLEHEIGNGIWLEGASGHTPGTVLIHAQSGQRHAVFVGDVFHSPIQIQDPHLHIGADNDGPLALKERQRLIKTYRDTDVCLFPAHFPDPSGGRVVSCGQGTRFAFLDD